MLYFARSLVSASSRRRKSVLTTWSSIPPMIHLLWFDGATVCCAWLPRRAGSRRGALRRLDGVDPMTAGESLQAETSRAREAHAGAGGELADDVGHKHLSGFGAAADASREVHRGTEEVALLGQGLSRVETNSHADRPSRGWVIARGERRLDGQRAFDGRPSRAERRQHAISGVLDLGAAAACKLVADHPVVGAKEILGSLVAQLLEQRCRPDHVGEHQHTQCIRRDTWRRRGGKQRRARRS